MDRIFRLIRVEHELIALRDKDLHTFKTGQSSPGARSNLVEKS